ncbi:MFS transporter [Streptomyces inhibens]|uniref:MFS transporter n=1 Tax=Streptomyces inhibens TaxID=2293571 RepID=A0A371Q368_STRIH|nr:MFS transporter [Streptomyces inhibens]REK89138.1 MFS transporter [Streptomyces inhibens]
MLTSRRPPGRGVAALLVAEVVSLTGSQLSAVALPWFVLTSTGSPSQMSWVMAAQFAPVAIFGLAAGSWAGRVGARRWMILSDLCRAVLTALVPVLYALGALPLPLLLVLVFGIGTFFAPYLASQQAVLAGVLGEDERTLARSGSLLQSATRTAVLLGPPAASALILLLGAPGVLLLDAASFLVAAALVRWAVPVLPREGGAAIRGRTREGLAVLRRDRLLRYWTVGTLLTESAWQALFAAVPLLVQLRFHSSVGMVGVLLAAFGGGALVGSLLATLCLRRVSALWLATAGKLLQALALVPLALGLPQWGLLLVLALSGVFNGLTNGPAAAVRLLRIPPELRTLVLSGIMTATLLGGTMGLVGIGVSFQAFGTQTPLTAIVVLQLVGTALFLCGSLRPSARRDSPAPTADPATASATATEPS